MYFYQLMKYVTKDVSNCCTNVSIKVLRYHQYTSLYILSTSYPSEYCTPSFTLRRRAYVYQMCIWGFLILMASGPKGRRLRGCFIKMQ
jgi:hypothetical protein